MPLSNLSPYPAAEAVVRDERGRMQVVVAVKATFVWDDRGGLAPTATEPPRPADVFAGEPASTGLAFAAEVGAPKPHVDVLLAGALAFPAPIERCDVSLLVGARLRKTVRVFGTRRWLPSLRSDLAPSTPAPVTRVPIDWALSFGGTDPADPARVERRNPVGSGVASRVETLAGHPAPQFEDPLRPLTSWKDRATPIGFGPIAPHWQPRIARAGTYDDRWRADRSPLPPEDFDARFFNVASDDQQLPSYVPGEELALVLGEHGMAARFALPSFELPITFITATAVLDAATRVDTILVEPEARRLSVIARAAFVPLPNVLAYRETLVGALSRGRRRALDTGRRYLARRSSVPQEVR
jgi:hypothetical protein